MCGLCIYSYACCALCRKNCRDRIVADACSNHCPLRSMYSDINLAKYKCYPIHSKCSINGRTVYIFICLLCLVSQALQWSVADACSNNCSLHSMYVFGHQASQTPVLSDTCRVLNTHADCLYIYTHVVPCVSGMTGNVADACFNYCPLCPMYRDSGIGKHWCDPTDGR
jgi:hypothetical protein